MPRASSPPAEVVPPLLSSSRVVRSRAAARGAAGAARSPAPRQGRLRHPGRGLRRDTSQEAARQDVARRARPWAGRRRRTGRAPLGGAAAAPASPRAPARPGPARPAPARPARRAGVPRELLLVWGLSLVFFRFWL